MASAGPGDGGSKPIARSQASSSSSSSNTETEYGQLGHSVPRKQNNLEGRWGESDDSIGEPVNVDTAISDFEEYASLGNSINFITSQLTYLFSGSAMSSPRMPAIPPRATRNPQAFRPTISSTSKNTSRVQTANANRLMQLQSALVSLSAT